MATEDIVGRDLGGDISQIVQSLKIAMDTMVIGKKVKYTGSDPAKIEKTEILNQKREINKENKVLIESLTSDLEKVLGNGFKEGQAESAKYVKEMAEKINDLTTTIMSGDLKTLKKKQQVLKKEEKKLASFQLMKAFKTEQGDKQDAQTNILQKILKCCEGGSNIGSQTSTISPSTSTSTNTNTNTSTDDSYDNSNIDFSKLRKKDFKFEDLFDGQEKTIRQVLFGNKSAIKGMMAELQSVSKNLLAIKDNQSLLQVFTEGTVESLLQYEQGMREALYLTAGATKESHDLFATMAQIGNTVEITGFKQEETQKAMVKLAKMGVRYDGDAEKYKKKLLGLTTTTLNTEKQLGLEAGSLQETFGDLYRFGVLNENSIANLGRGMREVSRTTGVSGEAFKKVLGTTQGIVDAMRKASTLTASSARNITELGANAEKFGVSDEINNINKALASTTNLFNDASDGTRLLLFSAAASVGKLKELQNGTLTRSKEGIKSLTEGVNNVFKRFGIESADAIDQLSDSAKMKLNLVLKSSFDLELGQVKGVLKTLEASGKTFADKLLDLDKQLGKNISTEKRSAILEEQRKIKIDKNLDLLGILSEAAETSKTMTDAFGKFGTRRKEFESDLQALGLGGSNKDVIREAVVQSLTGVNAALSKAGLDKISISTAEMAKALEDPQSYQDLLSTLKNGEMKAAANSKGTLTGIDAVRFGIDKLNADIQKTIAGPLSSFLNQGALTHIIANAGLLLMPGIIAAIPSIVTAVIGMKILKRLPLAGGGGDVGGGGGGGDVGGDRGSRGSRGSGGVGRTKSWARFGRESGQGALTFAGNWAKFAANVVIIAGLLALGYAALKLMNVPTEQETEELISKIKYLGIAMSAATVMVGEIYLISLAASAISKMPVAIDWRAFLVAGGILLSAGLVLPTFMNALIGITSASATWMGANPNEMVDSAITLSKFLGAGALVIAALAGALVIMTGVGAAAWALVTTGAATGGITIGAAIGFLAAGAVMMAAAGGAVPLLVKGIVAVTEGSMSAFNVSPEKIAKSLDRLLAILVPFSELLGVIALIGAALAGFAVGGLAAGAVGATAYIIGGLVGFMNSSLGGTEYKNYGDVNDLVGEALRHYSSLIKATITAVSTYMGDLTPSKVLRSLDKLQSFNEVNAVLGKTLADFGKSFGDVIPAFAIIGMTSSKLQGVKATTPEEVSNSFSGIINILKGINNLAVQFEADQTTKLNPAQIVSLTSFMDVISKNALPLFNALAAIDTVVNSASFKTTLAAEKTFKKAGELLKNITPYIGAVISNIQTISTKIYEQLKDVSFENVKEGSQAATEIIKMFSVFMTSIKNSSKELNTKDIKTFAGVFADGDVVNALRTVMQNTANIAAVFSDESYSQYTLSAISAKTKYYNEFYSSIGGLLESYKKISELLGKEAKTKTIVFPEKTIRGEYTPERKITQTIEEAAKTPLSDIDPADFKRKLTGSFSLLRNILDVATDKTLIPDFGLISKASVNLNSFKNVSVTITNFLNSFTSIVTSISSFSEVLNKLPELEGGEGAKDFSKISVFFNKMIVSLRIMNTNFKSSDTFTKDFIANMNTFHSLKEPLIKMGEVFSELEKISTTLKGNAAFWDNFEKALPQEGPLGIDKKIGYLKLYLNELSKITAPDFVSMLKSVAGIQGIAIDFKTNSAIELLSNLNSFMNSMKAEIDKQDKNGTPATATKGPAQNPNLKIEAMSKFLNDVAVPMLLSVKTIADKISNLPMNKTQLDRANQTIGSLSQLGGSLASFSTSFMTASNSFTESFIKLNKEGKQLGVYKIKDSYIQKQKEIAQANFDTITKGMSDEQKLVAAGSKELAEYAKKEGRDYSDLYNSNEVIADAANKLQKEGKLKVSDAWDFTPSMVTNADMLKEAINNPELIKSFQTIASIPKFFNDNILNPFLKGGGASLGPSKIDFVFKSLEGTKKIIELLTGPDSFIQTVRNLSAVTDLDKNSSSVLLEAKKTLDSFGANDLFASFLASLLTNIIIPMRFAAKIAGGEKNIEQASKSFGAITGIVKNLPGFLESINIGLGGLKKTDAKGNTGLNNAINNINSIKNTLPKFLDALSYDIILPVLKNLPPVAFIAQASRRLELASKLADSLQPFIGKFADLNAKIGGNFESFNLVTCLTGFITKLNPADEALSMLAEKLITIKESLQSIADSMNNIMSINSKSDVISMLSGIYDFSNNMAEKINNAVSTSGLQGITSRMEINSVSKKEEQADKDIGNIAENSEENVSQNNAIISRLNKIIDIWTSSSKTSSNGVNNSKSSNGAIVLNSGTGGGDMMEGMIFNSTAYGNSVKL